MAKNDQTTFLSELGVRVSETSRGVGPTTKYNRFYEGLRAAILDGRLQANLKLPSSRQMAADEGIARSIVVEVYGQLTQEGYLFAKAGSGSFVTPGLAEKAPVKGRQARHLAGLRETVTPFKHTGDGGLSNTFAPNQPALDLFPLAIWKACVSRALRQPGQSLLGDGDPMGLFRLRQAIAMYLSASRGLSCDPSQIVVVTSVQQALDLVVQLVTRPGDTAAVEDPCYPGAVANLSRAGLRIQPVPVDREGFNVYTAVKQRLTPKIIYVTPAHQAPLGVTMTAERRVALLEWARSIGAFIFEDDYDSEFRYFGRPIGTLKQLDRFDLVIQAGCFSKTMFPGLRISYIVASPLLAERLASLRSITSRFQSLLEQSALAYFLEDGHYGRHLKAMRSTYAARRGAILEAIAACPTGLLTARQIETGLDVLCDLPRQVSDKSVVANAAKLGLHPFPLSRYAVQQKQRPALLIGFSDLTPALAPRKVALLQNAVRLAM